MRRLRLICLAGLLWIPLISYANNWSQFRRLKSGTTFTAIGKDGEKAEGEFLRLSSRRDGVIYASTEKGRFEGRVVKLSRSALEEMTLTIHSVKGKPIQEAQTVVDMLAVTTRAVTQTLAPSGEYSCGVDSGVVRAVAATIATTTATTNASTTASLSLAATVLTTESKRGTLTIESRAEPESKAEPQSKAEPESEARPAFGATEGTTRLEVRQRILGKLWDLKQWELWYYFGATTYQAKINEWKAGFEDSHGSQKAFEKLIAREQDLKIAELERELKLKAEAALAQTVPLDERVRSHATAFNSPDSLLPGASLNRSQLLEALWVESRVDLMDPSRINVVLETNAEAVKEYQALAKRHLSVPDFTDMPGPSYVSPSNPLPQRVTPYVVAIPEVHPTWLEAHLKNQWMENQGQKPFRQLQAELQEKWHRHEEERRKGTESKQTPSSIVEPTGLSFQEHVEARMKREDDELMKREKEKYSSQTPKRKKPQKRGTGF